MDSEHFELGALEPQQLEGGECFRQGGMELPQSVLSFWRWAYSNLAANNLRGYLAEFIVASDLGVVQGRTRIEWDDCDLQTLSGIRVEVKSAAYLQSWSQSRHSAISFGIAPSYGWDADEKVRIEVPVRNSKAYVFCLLKAKDKRDLSLTNLDQWEFYVLPTCVLEQLGSQKTLSLGSLLRLCPVRCQYGEIGKTIERLVGAQEMC